MCLNVRERLEVCGWVQKGAGGQVGGGVGCALFYNFEISKSTFNQSCNQFLDF